MTLKVSCLATGVTGSLRALALFLTHLSRNSRFLSVSTKETKRNQKQQTQELQDFSLPRPLKKQNDFRTLYHRREALYVQIYIRKLVSELAFGLLMMTGERGSSHLFCLLIWIRVAGDNER